MSSPPLSPLASPMSSSSPSSPLHEPSPSSRPLSPPPTPSPSSSSSSLPSLTRPSSSSSFDLDYASSIQKEAQEQPLFQQKQLNKIPESAADIATLQRLLREAEVAEALHMEEQQVLMAELAALRMCLKSNSSIDMDFLRNIFVNFFLAETEEAMRTQLPMISGLLELSQTDVERIQNAWIQKGK
eukprot:CAMPEP_0201528566 /NCGR_PEP_ID=MMETSP0161_2-20130828/38698_1 /ASSEMBLY_ACC=CAM_ASM_000251 /TAXON_ID=180227 /ORGANISM="Neoparamoeba aestuarina, Strain SoJaBio B1-5/56/2" /LENGTH=184 /DNA_ID=CAMNT_0047929885 /DNA_START=515 /DNA_END=1066 /DNA_ORIENTATION=-